MNYELNDKWSLYLQYKDLGTTYSTNLEKLIETIEKIKAKDINIIKIINARGIYCSICILDS